MAYKDPNRAREASKMCMRKYRERLEANGFVLKWVKEPNQKDEREANQETASQSVPEMPTSTNSSALTKETNEMIPNEYTH